MKRYSEMTPEERMELIKEEASVARYCGPYGRYIPAISLSRGRKKLLSRMISWIKTHQKQKGEK